MPGTVREVEIEPGVVLWVQDLPAHRPSPAAPVLLVQGAGQAGLAWPHALVEVLRERHRVVRYDHRDTGRSTHAFDDRPYAVTDLATDALAVLDGCGIGRAHLVGISLGGVLVQLLALEVPQRLVSATLLCTAALDGGAAGLPGPTRDVLRMWQELGDPRDEAGELAWRVEYWRRVSGGVLPFDTAEFAARERRVMEHGGRIEPCTAHTQADVDGLDRGDELGSVTVPTLVVEAPEDPVHPPPHAEHLAARIGAAAQLVTVDGMGHALPDLLCEPIAAVLLEHAAEAEEAEAAAPTAHRDGQPTQR
ncbi:alpha/beta fold hydrolase [Pseudonocardia sp. HH130629-09]|uniref:alpha/beta fold hydrolase n=1 Tax=Pseudonocardia sp. HH130629-09 TaxID=1641402 RepID=UPI0006CB400E|nr:alpha/beta hydrolase [Pseudonocardia sp. HH130629-09]ALE82393.1 esterase [Pseudonocardia sp. HH130629-09]